MRCSLLFSFLAASACTTSLPAAEDAALICANDDECLSGQRCNQTSNRCVPSDRDDLSAPQVVSASVEPAIGTRETEFELLVELDEAPAVAPGVFVPVAAGRVDFELQASSATTFTARFSGAVFGTDDEFPLVVTTEDSLGNRFEGPLGLTVTIDSLAPALIPDSVRFDFAPNALDPQFPINPLSSTSELTTGTSLTLSFVVDEVPASAAIETEPPIAFELIGGLSTSLSFELDRSAPLVSGPVAVSARVVDLAGNIATLGLGSLVVDVTPPAPPDTSPGQIVYERRPTGDLHDPSGASRVVGLAGSVEPNSRVFAQSTLGATLGETVASAQGSFELDLPVIDLAVIELVVVDAAGNTSDLSPGETGVRGSEVLDGCFTATPRAEGLIRPHRLSAYPVATRYVDGAAPTAVPNAQVEFVDDTSASVATGTHWRLLREADGQGPRFRIFPAAGYIPTTGEVIVRGGSQLAPSGLLPNAAFDPIDDQRLYRFGHWQQQQPADPEGDGNPGFEIENMIFDRRLGGLLTEPDANGQSWLFEAGSWRQIGARAPLTIDPSTRARTDRRLAHARRPGRTFMVIAGEPAQLWTYDAGQWRIQCGDTLECDGLPTVQSGFSLTYDDARDVLLIFDRGRTWTVSVTGDPIWTLSCDGPDCAGPAERFASAIAYENARERVVLYGGCGLLATGGDEQCEELFVDTWVWDGSQWTCVIPEGLRVDSTDCDPMERPECLTDLCNVTFTVNPDTDVPPDAPVDVPLNGYGGHLFETDDGLLLVQGQGYVALGGTSFGRVRQGEHLLRGDVWSSRSTDRPVGQGPAQQGGVLVAHESSGDLVFVSRNSFSLWDGEEWSVGDRGDLGLRDSSAMVYDPRTDEIVLFGGASLSTEFGDTWTWSPESGWVEQCESGCTAPPLAGITARMAYDESLDTVLLYDEFDCLDLNVVSPPVVARYWTGSDWVDVCDGGCPPRFVAPACEGELAAVGERGEVHLYGGSSLSGLTVSVSRFDRWSDAVNPPDFVPVGAALPFSFERVAHQFTADPVSGLAYVTGGGLFGGIDVVVPPCGPEGERSVCADVLEVGTEGISIASLVRGFREGYMPARSGHVATYSPRDDGIYVYGGRNINEFFGDSWLLDFGRDDRPRHVFSVAFADAGVPDATVTSLEVRAVVGGDGADGSGVELLVWDYLRWRPTDVEHSASSGEPAELVWDSRASPDFTALPIGEERELHLALQPASPAGTAGSTVVTDAVDARVCYRR